MKPKERFYSYALLPSNCDHDASGVKDDSPIDLSTKRQSPIVPIVHSISPFASSDFDAHSITSPLNYSEWPSKYLLSNTSARNLQTQAPSSLLPYLLLNRPCFDVPPRVAESPIEYRTSKNGLIYDQYGNKYTIGQGPSGPSLIPLRSSPIIDIPKSGVYERVAHNGSHRSSLNNSSSTSSSPSTNSHQDYNETRRLLERSPTNSSLCPTPDESRINRSQNRSSNSNSSNNNSKFSLNLIRSSSFPSLVKTVKMSRKPFFLGKSCLVKSKSESSLPQFYYNQQEKSETKSPPKVATNGNNINHSKTEATRKYSKIHSAIIGQYYNKNGTDMNDSDPDKDDEDPIESGGSDDYGSDDALDLRVTNSLPRFHPDLAHPDAESLFHQINAFLNQHSPEKEEISASGPSPLDLYRQYYYCLMHQPAFASRAAAAVAVAETYAKLITSASHQNHRGIHHHASVDHSDNNTSMYETENDSPDYIINGTRAELRSADTTNNGISFDRKRISRPLTGKHVRHGTGASPSTLITLRNMIQERQRLKEIGGVEVNKYGKGKGGKRVKRK